MVKEPNYENMTLDELDEVKSELYNQEKAIADKRRDVAAIYKRKVTEYNEASKREPREGDVTVTLGQKD